MFLIIAKIVATALGALAISSSYANWRHRREPTLLFAFWTVVWLMTITVAIYPPIVDFFLKKSDSGRAGLGTIFGLGLVFLLFICYKLFAKAERVERQLNELISALAVREKIKVLSPPRAKKSLSRASKAK